MRILVTGAAGFVGFHLSARLLSEGHEVVGVDNFSAYYDMALKRARVAQLADQTAFDLHEFDLSDRARTEALFSSGPWDRVVHLAAQAGVRHSLDNPHAYIDSNVVGFLNVLEGCRHNAVPHLVYASSSSVYGDDSPQPFHTAAPANSPISLYAATKRSGELMAHSYAHLFDMNITGLRFFTVYGPWGRPDMAYFKFTELIEAGQPIPVFGGGLLQRDFTYVDDIVEGITRIMDHMPGKAALYNIGAGRPQPVVRLIAALEKALGKSAQRQLEPMQPGDVQITWADTAALESAVGFRPSVALEDGVGRFVRWYRTAWGKKARG